MAELDPRLSRHAAPILEPADFASVAAAMAEGNLGRGPQNDLFEAELEKYLSAHSVVTVSSGTTALQLALIAAGVQPGDDVCVPSFTFCASVQAILAVGARPVFFDNAPESLCFDIDDLLNSVTPATRAVMPVHYGGRHTNLDRAMEQLSRSGISVVEDAAHAFGSVRDDGLPFTARDSWVCFSFDAIKTITCGEGGAIVPPRSATAEVPRLLRALGMDRVTSDLRRGDYVVSTIGFRAHLAEMNAALGRSQLARAASTAASRRAVWGSYRERLAEVQGTTLYDVDIEHTVPFNCAITVDPRIRDDLVDALRSRGVAVGRHYPANHRQPAFETYATRPLPNADWASSAVVTLPFGPDLTTLQVATVCAVVEEELRQLPTHAAPVLATAGDV